MTQDSPAMSFPIGPCSLVGFVTHTAFLTALGRSPKPEAGTEVFSTVDEMPTFLRAKALQSFISKELIESSTPYIIVLGYEIASRAEMQEYLDTLGEIPYWYACLPNAIFCLSPLTAHQLAEKISGYFGTMLFLVMECTARNCQGLLPKKVWEMMQSPDRMLQKEAQ